MTWKLKILPVIDFLSQFKRNYACGKFTLFTIEKIPMLREELNCTLARDQRMNQFIYVNIGLRIFQCKKFIGCELHNGEFNQLTNRKTGYES